MYFRPFVAQNTLLAIFVALCAFFRCSVSDWSCATLLPPSLGGHFFTRSFPHLDILIWLGAVIVQSGRQFDENGKFFDLDIAFLDTVWYN